MSREPTPPPGSPPAPDDEQAIRSAVADLAKQLGRGDAPPASTGAPTEQITQRRSDSMATVRRVTIRRPAGGSTSPGDDEDVWVVPGSKAAAAEATASVTTSTGAPVSATTLATDDAAARRFRPSRWIPGVATLLVLGVGVLFWAGILPWQRAVDLSMPASNPTLEARRPAPQAEAPAAAPSTAAPPPSAPAAEPARPSGPKSADSPAPAATAGVPGERSADAPRPSASAAPPTAPSGAPTGIAPSFDIARVSPDGRAVIAGRAAPGSKVTVLDGDRELVTVQADARGEWAAVIDQPPLPPGAHDLRLVQRDGSNVTRGERTVTVVVPTPQVAVLPDRSPSPGTAAPPPTGSAGPTPAAPSGPLVVSTPGAGGPSTVLQAPGGPDTLARSGTLVLGAVDYDEQGRTTLSGRAPPGTVVRVYIDNQPVGEATTGADGTWVVQPGEPVAAGRRAVRVDQIGPGGAVVSRLEVPFERMILAKPGVVTIVRGDNLWSIARSRYGDGLRYTAIFEANKNQIRDPNLIYPGQIFVVPKTP